MNIAEQISIALMIGVCCDNGTMSGSTGWEGTFTTNDKNDLVKAVEEIDSECSIMDPVHKWFPHFEMCVQSDTVFDFIVSPEYSEWDEFTRKFPEYKPLHEILSRWC